MRRILLSLFLALAACATVGTPAPAQAFTIKTGATIQLMAATAGPAVTWAVVEANSGSVSASGVYTSPACPFSGTVHVTATSGSVTSTVTITVLDQVKTVTVAPPTATVAPQTTQQFTATVTTVCGAVSTSP